MGTVLYAMPVLFSFSTRGIRAKLFGFKGQQHEISAIPIEAYQDEEATAAAGLVPPSPFKKSYLAKAQSSLNTVGGVSNTPSFVRLSMAASTPEPAIASDEKLTATALERKKRVLSSINPLQTLGKTNSFSKTPLLFTC